GPSPQSWHPPGLDAEHTPSEKVTGMTGPAFPMKYSAGLRQMWRSPDSGPDLQISLCRADAGVRPGSNSENKNKPVKKPPICASQATACSLPSNGSGAIPNRKLTANQTIKKMRTRGSRNV